MGHIAQQLALAVDQALQMGAHAIEVSGQHAQFVLAARKTRQGVLLIGGLAEIVHRAPQVIERPGQAQGQQQAEEGQHHGGDGQHADRPEQTLTAPGA